MKRFITTFLTHCGIPGSLVLALSLATASAQKNTVAEQYSIATLPTLDAVIAATLTHSPTLQSQESLIRKNRYQLKRTEQLWTDAISVSANYQQGAYGTTSLRELNLGYQAGVYLRVSVFDIISRNNQVGVFQEELRISEHKKNELQRMLRQQVIAYYNQVRLAKTLIQIKSEAKQATLIHQQMAEKEFTQGQTPVSELARVTEITAKASAEFEIAKMDYIDAYAQLQEVVGVNLLDL